MNPRSVHSEINHLITHSVSQESIKSIVIERKERIRKEDKKSDSSVEEQLKLIDDLTQFEFGQFLLINRGINGYWTRYMVLWPKRRSDNLLSLPSLHPLERWLLEEAPIVLATQERFTIFQRLLQESLHNDMVLASIPCGTMDDLLTLDLSDKNNIKLVGMDLDPQSINEAMETSRRMNLNDHTKFIQADAWKSEIKNEFDIITSNGLNIYELDDNRVILLYRRFYDALKFGGVLISSFLTPPPNLNAESPWEMKNLNSENLRLQKVIFSYILSAKWQAFRTEAKTIEQLKTAGFKEIQIIYDKNKMFPTFRAKK